MSLTSPDWHNRFNQQARWTRDIRHYLLERANVNQARRVLEVGCGTGALLAQPIPSSLLYGLDINKTFLIIAQRHAPGARLIQGDAHRLPYPTGCFDIVFCHFLLLWVADPRWVVAEMARVTCPGGAVIALAEPDYGGRTDYPLELAQLGRWQQQALEDQGADSLSGRKLNSLFHQVGLLDVECGVLGGQWRRAPSPEEWQAEWDVLQEDLQSSIDRDLLNKLRRVDAEAWRTGERILYVPTFYAIGWVSRSLSLR